MTGAASHIAKVEESVMKIYRHIRKAKRLSASTAAAILAAALLMTGCGSGSPALQQMEAQEKAQAEEAATAEAAKEAAAEAEAQAAAKAAEEEAAKKAAEAQKAEQEAAAKAAAKSEAVKKAEEESAAHSTAKEEIAAEDTTVPAPLSEKSGNDEKTDDGAKEKEAADAAKEKGPAAGADSSWLDGTITFDGMELTFPIEMKDYKLGDWKITFEEIKDPASRTVKPDEMITAVMTCDKYTDDDVIVTAEFGNYGEEPVQLSELPMTGIYLRRGPGKAAEDGTKADPVLPEVVIAKDITWGSSAEQLWAAFGEPSFSGLTNEDFDGMYENGSYYMEVAGMTDIGIDYIVYSVE